MSLKQNDVYNECIKESKEESMKNNYWTFKYSKKTKDGLVNVIQNDTTYEVKEVLENGKVLKQYLPKK